MKKQTLYKTIFGTLLTIMASWLAYLLLKPTTEIEDVKTGISIMDEFMEVEELKNLAMTYSYGGVFPASEFAPRDTNNFDEGIMMWYCLDTVSKNPKFFMAIERAEISKLPTEPGKNQLISDKLSKYDGSGTSNFLTKDHGISIAALNHPHDLTTSKIKGFKSFLTTKDPKNKLKQVPFAFFQNNKSKTDPSDPRGLLQQLCEQPGTKYIRYYFGCDSSRPSNKIRILLFSVDQNGNNILYVKDNTSGVMKAALVLQRSIPPVEQ